MAFLQESHIENADINFFVEQLGYQHINAWEKQLIGRKNLKEVVLKDRLKAALLKLNSNLPESCIDFAITELTKSRITLEPIGAKDAATLLREAEAAIKDKDQARACALVSRYAELGHAPRAAFDVLLKFAVSEDGALHAEKYYRTVSEEFATTRPAFRNRQLAALARVTASEAGFPAPGYAEACKLVKG